jgi:site-specific DNA recombinase
MIKDPNCKNKNWKMIELDQIVFDEIRKFVVDPNFIKEIKAEEHKKDDGENKVSVIEKEIEKIDAQIDRFMNLYGIGKFTVEQLSGKTDPLNEERAKLIKELKTLNAESGRLTEEEAIEIFETFEETLEYGDFDEIRAMIESLIYYIEIDNEDIFIHWKFA